MILALCLLLSFCLGSILGGQIIGRLQGLDLRQSGSGNLGATNALRSGGTRAGLLVLLIDASKAWVAAAWVPLLAGPDAPDWLAWTCGALAVMGHIYSPLAGFAGGKGVASAIGAYLALLPTALAVGLAGFVPVLILSGYVSLSVLVASLLILFYVACLSTLSFWSPAGAFASTLLVVLAWTHRENIARLIRGEENRFRKVMLFDRNRHS